MKFRRRCHRTASLLVASGLLVASATAVEVAAPVLPESDVAEAETSEAVSSFVGQFWRRSVAPAEAIETPADYLDAALRLMERYSLYRDTADWPVVQRRAHESIADAQWFSDTYPAIRRALEDIGDHHGFLKTPKPPPPAVVPKVAETPDATEEEPKNAPRPERPLPEVRLLPDRIGYVKLFAHSGPDFDTHRRYVADVHARIGRVAEDEPIGWIVDLRHNGGGNMWPMLYGIGPILGEGVAGHFAYPDGTQKSWAYQTQPILAFIDPYVGLLPDEPCTLGDGSPWAAVLTGEGTGSSGEAIAVSFRARPRSRSFGAPTSGFSTATNPYALPDGARLFLTVSAFADRAGHVYGKAIEPDEVIDGDDAAVLFAAKAWLLENATHNGE